MSIDDLFRKYIDKKKLKRVFVRKLKNILIGL